MTSALETKIPFFFHDTVKDQPEGVLEFTTELRNAVKVLDLLPHEWKLKKNAVLILFLYLDVSEGPCNGVRLIVTDLCNKIIKAKIISGK